MSNIQRRMLILIAVLLLFVCTQGTADVFVGQQKPEDWNERKLLTIVAAETVYNDAFIIQQGTHTMIVDGGAAICRKRILKYLREHNLTEPEIYFNTHPHDDHLEAVWKMLRDGEFHPAKFVSMFPKEYRNTLQQNTVKVLDQLGIPYEKIENEDEFNLGEAHFTAFQYENGDEPNELSGVLLLQIGEATMLLTGDLPGEGQRWFVQAYGEKLHADILKVPHHGITPMFTDFLLSVNPTFAFVTNRSNGTQKLNKQLKKYEVPYMHHSIGSIILETDGKDWYVEQVKDLI